LNNERIEKFYSGDDFNYGDKSDSFRFKYSGHITTEFACVFNTVISIICGILSNTVVAFLQQRWRVIEDELRYKREHQQSKQIAISHYIKSKSD